MKQNRSGVAAVLPANAFVRLRFGPQANPRGGCDEGIRRPMKHVFALAALLLLLPNLSLADEFGVTPGVGIGHVRLGESRAVVRKRLGKPAAVFPARDGRHAELWTTCRPATRFSVPRTVVTFRAGRAAQVEIAVSTRRTFGQIVKSHPSLRVTRFVYDDFVYSYYDDVSGGVAYAVGAQDFISRAFSPDAILVHPRGRPVIPAPGGKRENSQPHLFSR